MFNAIYGGCNSRQSIPFHMSRPNGLDHYVLLLVKTRAQFIIGNKKMTSIPNSAIIIRPYTPYCYSSPDAVYMDDWMHFSCDSTEFPGENDFPFHVFIPLDNISRYTALIQQILWEKNYTSDIYKYENVDLLFKVLMNNLYISCREGHSEKNYHPYRTKLRNLRLAMQAEPYKAFDMKATADSIGISPSYFQHLYSDTFGKSFRSDLISLRVEYAKELILNTSLTMEQIAEQSGYSSEVHFYRQFQKETGFTPASLRKMNL